MLTDGTVIAVKKFKDGVNVEEFVNEFLILSQINNINVVKILGCCLETEIPLMVDEFYPNGELKEYLHGQHDESIPIKWDMILRIASEISAASYYLHSLASQSIYHRDIKSANILLDEKFRVKLADFGFSRLVPIDATHITASKIRGTTGYYDPEYTEKSDVFSFAVVLVELLSSKKSVFYVEETRNYENLGLYFVECMDENKLAYIIDKRRTEDGKEEQIISVENLAYLHGRNRPTNKEATMELERIRKQS